MKNKEENMARLSLIVSMVIFGTIGIFRKYIDLPSGVIAMMRGLIGALFLALLTVISRRRPDFAAIRRGWLPLCGSGALIGFNWILLFEAYRFTTVATATLCYYMAPVIVLVASPLLFREKITLRKALCAVVAVAGIVLVSGVLEANKAGVDSWKGVLLGLGAAVLYASVVLINKKTANIPARDRTMVQLGTAGLVVLPYAFIAEGLAYVSFSITDIVLLLIVGVVHTGATYALYFGSMKNLKAQTVALYSYIDPVVAIILSALLLKEPMTLMGGIGAVLVLGSMLVSDLPERKSV